MNELTTFDEYGLITGTCEPYTCPLTGNPMIPGNSTDLPVPELTEEQVAVMDCEFPNCGDSRTKCKWNIFDKNNIVINELTQKVREMTEEEKLEVPFIKAIASYKEKGIIISDRIQKITECIGGLYYLDELTLRAYAPFELNSGEVREGSWLFPDSNWVLIQ